MEMKNRTLRILIGDDCFEDRRNAVNHLTLALIAMKERAASTEPIYEENIVAGFYKTLSPLSNFDQIEFRVVDNTEELINESQNGYHWVISDLNYGPGKEEAGIDALERVRAFDSKLITALFTSESNKVRLNELRNTNHGINYFLASVFQDTKMTKDELLGRKIAEHYLSGELV